jgi:hypothetical protein
VRVVREDWVVWVGAAVVGGLVVDREAAVPAFSIDEEPTLALTLPLVPLCLTASVELAATGVLVCVVDPATTAVVGLAVVCCCCCV